MTGKDFVFFFSVATKRDHVVRAVASGSRKKAEDLSRKREGRSTRRGQQLLWDGDSLDPAGIPFS